MLIMADGSFAGLLSGGCLEADLKIRAEDVMKREVARAVEYDMRGPGNSTTSISTVHAASPIHLTYIGPAGTEYPWM
jgi:hypothetical protein